jgi:Rieske Fe-S protein
VQWNATLATWDCPCRGSRFDAEGNVVNGPAERAVERIEIYAASVAVGSRAVWTESAA